MNKIDILGHKQHKVSEKEIVSVIRDSLAEIGLDNSFIQVSFVSDTEIRKLNEQYRQIDHATDVLSFPQPEVPGAKIKILGDLAISIATVEKKGEALDDVVKHGLLHLLGHDHEADQADWDVAANKINCKY